jgi:hypothetical protein
MAAGEEPPLEEGLLYQSLGKAIESETVAQAGVVRLCSTEPKPIKLCAGYTDSLGIEGLAREI